MPELPARESGGRQGRSAAARTGRGGRDTPARTPAAGPGSDEPRAAPETDAERMRRRALFLRDLAEARELRARVQPRRAKAARLRRAMRMRTFRW
ncbi:hypothetical protein [Streptomyces sp. V3I7]|uniref:hypothetical protein n=1 Tax=Streptomyces sp. V3I7 TaxID=3042278 RepID=UPI002786E489|nr:hypothetical protein [Streptomyces sp. V3I7]MDQ0991774.1 hypothetical protein [Streptomyces sp. V3I7]